MTKRDVIITISTSRLDSGLQFFQDNNCTYTINLDEPETKQKKEMPPPTEMITDGKLVTSPTRVELLYEETVLSGMEGSVTAIGFDRNEPGMISMIRSGKVSTALIFEEGVRHYSVFETPFSTFQLCTYTELVENRLLTDGTIRIEYIIEIRGAQAERCHMDISFRDDISPFKIIK